jgi:hypothetical protein
MEIANALSDIPLSLDEAVRPRRRTEACHFQLRFGRFQQVATPFRSESVGAAGSAGFIS